MSEQENSYIANNALTLMLTELNLLRKDIGNIAGAITTVLLEQREALKSINSNLVEILEVLKKDKR